MAGTTYQDLNILISNIRESGYLEGRWEKEQSPQDVQNNDDKEEEPVKKNGTEANGNNTEAKKMLGQISTSEPDETSEAKSSQRTDEATQSPGSAPAPAPVPAPAKPEISPSFNFLQESQIDLESPHMDPAVVMVHPAKGPVQPSGKEISNFQLQWLILLKIRWKSIIRSVLSKSFYSCIDATT